jgi:hypothetical protein
MIRYFRARSRTVKLRPAAVVVAAALACASVLFPATTSVAQAAETASAIPRTAGGKPDFSGLWQTLSTADWDLEPHGARKDALAGLGVVVGGEIPYQAWAAEKRKENFEKREELDPRNKCYLPGIPRATYSPYPFQIFQGDSHLTLLYEYAHTARTIHTNGTKHLEGHIDWWLGDSRGHWEGDTLVVDVIHFNDQTWLDHSGNFHSDALHVVEALIGLRIETRKIAGVGIAIGIAVGHIEEKDEIETVGEGGHSLLLGCSGGVLAAVEIIALVVVADCEMRLALRVQRRNEQAFGGGAPARKSRRSCDRD